MNTFYFGGGKLCNWRSFKENSFETMTSHKNATFPRLYCASRRTATHRIIALTNSEHFLNRNFAVVKCLQREIIWLISKIEVRVAYKFEDISAIHSRFAIWHRTQSRRATLYVSFSYNNLSPYLIHTEILVISFEKFPIQCSRRVYARTLPTEGFRVIYRHLKWQIYAYMIREKVRCTRMKLESVLLS